MKVGDFITCMDFLSNHREKIIYINKKYVITEWEYMISIINRSCIFKNNENAYSYNLPYSKWILNKNGTSIYIYE